MSAPAKLLLGKACAAQRQFTAGIIDLTTLALPRLSAEVARGTSADIAACALSYPAKDRFCAGSGFVPEKDKAGPTAVPLVASHLAAGKAHFPAKGNGPCTHSTSLALREQSRMEKTIDVALNIFKEYGQCTARFQALYGQACIHHRPT